MGPGASVAPPVNKLTIVIVGEGGVGKSSLTLQFIKKQFFEDYDPTIDDSYVTTIIVDDAPWQIEVLDTAGQEEYRGLWVEHSVSHGEAFIITYAINSTKSFRAVPDFLKLIASCKGSHSGYRSKSPTLKPRYFPFPFVIAGNKEDLIGQRTIPISEGVQLANATGGLFYECSAKNAINVEELFVQLVRGVTKLREGELAHRKDPKMPKQPFIHNIGYHLSQQTALGNRASSHSVFSSQPFPSWQDVSRNENPNPCSASRDLSESVNCAAPQKVCPKSHPCHEVRAQSTANQAAKCGKCLVA